MARNSVVWYRLKHMTHRWFAWHPVKVHVAGKRYKMKWVWLKWVHRKGKYWLCEGGEGWDWWYWEIPNA